MRWGCLVAVAIAVCAAPAFASGSTPVRNEQLSVSGSLAFSWQGDPARGCAAEGVCGIHGALIVTAPDGGDLTRFRGATTVYLNSSATVRVQRSVNGSIAGECVDVLGSQGGFGSELFLSGSTARVDFGEASSGRCAGPVGADLVSLKLPLKRRVPDVRPPRNRAIRGRGVHRRGHLDTRALALRHRLLQ